MSFSSQDAPSDDESRSERHGASAAFYFFVGTLALSLLTMLAGLFLR
jgi:hypothetical protein